MVKARGRDGSWDELYEVRVSHYPDGRVRGELWLKDGKIHREGGPASSTWDEAGVLISEAWYQNGRWHRSPWDGPASWSLDAKKGVILQEGYYWEGRPHRIDGPALISRSVRTGLVVREEWVVHGVIKRMRPRKPRSVTPRLT